MRSWGVNEVKQNGAGYAGTARRKNRRVQNRTLSNFPNNIPKKITGYGIILKNSLPKDENEKIVRRMEAFRQIVRFRKLVRDVL